MQCAVVLFIKFYALFHNHFLSIHNVQALSRNLYVLALKVVNYHLAVGRIVYVTDACRFAPFYVVYLQRTVLRICPAHTL